MHRFAGSRSENAVTDKDLQQNGADTGLCARSMRARFRSVAARFARDESGTMIAFALVSFVGMIAAAGMAIDFMRFENTRTRLQATLDRSVLAAASLNQTLDPEDVVEDYFAKADLPTYDLSVTVEEGLNYRTVSAEATSTFSSYFLRMVGIESMTAEAQGTAEERVQNVEISMVLDISGSMGSYSRLSNLKTAAKEFVEAVLTTANQDKVSISLIPYSGAVNAGEDIYEEFTTNTVHGYSHCLEFDETDFASTTLDRSKTYDQVQHFAWSSSSYHPIRYPWCPAGTQSYAGQSDNDNDYSIVAFSQSESALDTAIDNLSTISMTGIHYGMKWAAGMLDPDFQTITAALATKGAVDTTFSDRPKAWDDAETIKVIVLMTDGENVDQYRIEDWAYNSSSEYEYWNENGLWWYLYRYVSSWYWTNYYDTVASASEADDMLLDACTAAKNAGITVFTIGFETSSHGGDVMEECASSAAHYYDVDGIEISQAFSAIAATIQKLKLVQ